MTKRSLITTLFSLAFAASATAQQTAANTPATKEDVEAYLQAFHSHELMQKTIDAMLKPMHQMIHDEYLKDKDKLPPDFETRETNEIDDMMKTFPWDDMMKAMVPVYQKHFSKEDMNALVAFYSGPTGQKVLREMPAITAETMQIMMPMIRQQLDAMNQKIQQQVAEMLKNSQKKPAQSPSGS
ncbi:MAG TPA: DUF2059 domain-containing protein [Candidatus Acidoferrales bacterium]|nr:DUF2059 domain-containing protein [Candidatus Acidoferrales bacterium]